LLKAVASVISLAIIFQLGVKLIDSPQASYIKTKKV